MKLRFGGLALALGITLMFGAHLLGGSAKAACPIEGCDSEGEVEGVPATLTITVNGSGSVKRGTVTLCSHSGPGSTVCEKTYEEGEEIDLSQVAGPGQTFMGWTGSCSGTGACDMTMDGDHSVGASFQDNTPPAPPTITVPTQGQQIELDSGDQVFVGFNNSGDSSAVAFLCRVDVNASSGAIGCNSPWATGPLSAGPHTIYVWARDASNNLSAPAARGFEVVAPSEPGPEGPGTEGPGTGSPSGGSQPTGGAGGSPLQAPPRVDAALRAKWKVVGDTTAVRRLVLSTVPVDALVSVSCRGRGCPFKRKQVAARNGSAKLTTLFAGAELAKGTVIKLVVTGPQGGMKTITVKVRDGRPPKVSVA
jgi:Divergent InlB B-repeat domain